MRPLTLVSFQLAALRWERDLAFAGAEDLVPSGFYDRPGAERARMAAATVVTAIRPHVED